jgi:asparagine synthase (glutamine-hydrolysing)
MCGICGIYGVDDQALVRRMMSLMKHRGPDDEGVYSGPGISLGHTRLSIIDLSEKGRQPMANEYGDIWLAVNGEIYNFRELRRELEKKGHRFYSNSDSETIIHTYEEYGLDFLNRLRGMFSLSLYDKKAKRLVLARDPIGKKPLYYCYDDGSFLFASEIKALLAAGVNQDIDREALFAYLAYQYTLGEKTLFKGIKKVLPGNMLVLEPGKFRIKKYSDIKENIAWADDDYFIKKLRALLEESTALRMIADVPVGAFLSGGIDSAAVVAMARPLAKGQFHTFSVGFETFSELGHAAAISQYLGTAHHEVTITADMVSRDLSRIAWYYDEPLGDAAIVNNYYLSQEAKKYVKVVIAGEGGDELFGGYPNYKKGLKYYPLFKLPAQFRNTAGSLLELIPGKGDMASIGNRVHKFSGYFARSSFEEAHLYTTRQMSNAEVRFLTGLDYPNIDDAAIYPRHIHEPLNRMLATDCNNLLPEKFLMKADKATMANSVEERLPLLDKEIVGFAFSIPPGLKIRGGQEKYILRKAVSHLLPEDVLARPKHGFGTPLGHWLRGGLKELAISKLGSGNLTATLVKRDSIKALLDGLDGGKLFRPAIVWTLLALEIWYETHFERSGTCM